MDQSVGCGGGARRERERGVGSCPPSHQHCPGGPAPHCRRRGRRGPWRRPHQLPGGEAAYAPPRRLPRRSAGPHLRGLQHVRGQLVLVRLSTVATSRDCVKAAVNFETSEQPRLLIA